MKRFPVTKALSIIILGGLLTGVTLATRYIRGRAENPSTWRSIEDKIESYF